MKTLLAAGALALLLAAPQAVKDARAQTGAPLLDPALSWRLSDGDPAGAGQSIINGSAGGQFFAVDALDLYAVAPIPGPGAAAMLAGGLGMVLLARRRRPDPA